METPAIVMTTAEWDVLKDRPSVRPVVADTSRADTGWIALKAAPCPYFDTAAKECTVYESRPFNCRRFQCGRWDVTTQPFTISPMAIIRADNDLRWSYDRNQRAHTEWALAHGWKP